MDFLHENHFQIAVESVADDGKRVGATPMTGASELAS
jgi:hypothetical protein